MNNNNQKSAFNSKYLTDNGFRSVFTTNWPNLFPAYTISYSAATGKSIENGKKKLFVLLVLLLLLIASLAASLILAFLWFNAINQTEYSNESIKINSNFKPILFDQNGLISSISSVSPSSSLNKPVNNKHHNNYHNFNNNPINYPNNNQFDSHFNEITNHLNKEQHYSTIKSTTTTTTTTPQSTTVGNNNESTANEDDGFGEKENENSGSFVGTNSNNNSQASSSTNDKDDEHLINYYKNFKNELERNRPNGGTNKIRHEEKLDGEFVEHHTVSIPDDDSNRDILIQPETVSIATNHAYESNQKNLPNLIFTENYSNSQVTTENLPEQLINLKAKQFCNLNSYLPLSSFGNSSLYECRSNLNSNLISSYFCNDKFVIVAKINTLKEKLIGQSTENSNERQFINRYDVHIERILKRSPFLSVAFKKQGLTTNITINLDLLSDELRSNGGDKITCLGQRIELKVGQTYLLSGRVAGLSAVSSNCDLQLEWNEDLDESQRNQLIIWSSRTTFSHC